MKGLALGSRISFLVDRMREYGGLVIVGGVVGLTEKARLPGWLFLLFCPCERFVMITNGGGFLRKMGGGIESHFSLLFLFADFSILLFPLLCRTRDCMIEIKSDPV